ncbi:LysR family transcriptional regulator [Oceanibacterium hippocampi]|uniref:HTH-type transcriptional activator CmpR n=1 Tax=Oceanibacterium hippocampi TaxID=745714 RepID=A0A1Y5TSZ4_9PROT|nr:LysR family transcriptional regulator [Oceanibacterium hippocampi]SLN70763.1 HTH-type transcriptional activator CmpR [Oceanibacterium hippocampi]
MDLKQLAALRAISEAGSFGQAAKRLRLTQSAVSYQIRNLEEELGQTLIFRSRPNVTLSPAGLTALRSYERILGEIDQLRISFGSRDEAEVSGELRVASSILGIVYLYGDLIGEFIYAHPRIEVKMTTTESGQEGARQVIARQTDVAFVAFPIDGAQLQSITLGVSEHVAIVPAEHRLAEFDSVTVDILRQHPFVRYAPGAGSRHATDRIFLSGHGYPPIILESNDTEFIKRVVRMGLGLAIVPSFTISAAKDPRLHTLRIEGQPTRQEFGLVFRRRVKSKTLDLFCEFARARASEILQKAGR